VPRGRRDRTQPHSSHLVGTTRVPPVPPRRPAPRALLAAQGQVRRRSAPLYTNPTGSSSLWRGSRWVARGWAGAHAIDRR
jgi:hypothetical protein